MKQIIKEIAIGSLLVISTLFPLLFILQLMSFLLGLTVIGLVLNLAILFGYFWLMGHLFLKDIWR